MPNKTVGHVMSCQLGLTCTFRAHASHGHTVQLSAGLSVFDTRLVISINSLRGISINSQKEEGVVGWSWYRDVNPVPTSPLANDLVTVPSRPVRFRSVCGWFYCFSFIKPEQLNHWAASSLHCEHSRPV